MNRRDFLKTIPAVLVLERFELQPPRVIKPEISEKRGFADFDLDGNGGWVVRGQTLVLEKAGSP